MAALAANPQWQEKLREEVTALGVAPDAPTSFDHLEAMPLAEMAFKEAMRLRPPVPSIPRRATRDFSFGGYQIPAGTLVGLNPLFTHHMPEIWPDPDAFDPMRFTDEAQRGRHRFAFVPFGGGAHMCLGLHFAYMQAKCFARHFLQNLSVSLPSRRYAGLADVADPEAEGRTACDRVCGQLRASGQGRSLDADHVDAVCASANRQPSEVTKCKRWRGTESFHGRAGREKAAIDASAQLLEPGRGVHDVAIKDDGALDVADFADNDRPEMQASANSRHDAEFRSNWLDACANSSRIAMKQRSGRQSIAPLVLTPGHDHLVADIIEHFAVIIHHRKGQKAKRAIEQAVDGDAAEPLGESRRSRDVDEQHEAIFLDRRMIASGDEVQERAGTDDVGDAKVRFIKTAMTAE